MSVFNHRNQTSRNVFFVKEETPTFLYRLLCFFLHKTFNVGVKIHKSLLNAVKFANYTRSHCLDIASITRARTLLCTFYIS